MRSSSSAPPLQREPVTLSHCEPQSDQRQLLLLAQTAAAQGDHEIAYCLYAKGCSEQSSAGVAQASSGGEVFKAGQLQTLAALCQAPLQAAVVADGAGGSGGTTCASSSLVACTATSSATADSTGFQTHCTSQRWQRMQAQLQLPQSNINPSSRNSCSSHRSPQLSLSASSHTLACSHGASMCKAASSPCITSLAGNTGSSGGGGTGGISCSCGSKQRRVFCVSDLHIDRAGGANMSWLKSIDSVKFKNDVIIVAGE